MNKVLLLSGFMSLAACAQQPDAIEPVSMAGAYEGVSCKRAQQMLVEEQAKLAALSEQQVNAATGDAIGVILLGVPTSSMMGGDKAGDIGTAKGKILALEARLESCRS